MVLKNYRYVFVMVESGGLHVYVFNDENALPSNVTAREIRGAKESPNEMRPGSQHLLGYMPIKGK